MKKVIIIVLLSLLTGFSVYYYNRQNEKVYISWLQANKANANNLPSDNISICKNVPLKSYFNKSKYLLLVLFEPTQCGSCLNEKTLWNEISNKKFCPVLGITSLEDSSEFHEYMSQSGLEFPVFYDPSACIQRFLNIPDTHVKCL